MKIQKMLLLFFLMIFGLNLSLEAQAVEITYTNLRTGKEITKIIGWVTDCHDYFDINPSLNPNQIHCTNLSIDAYTCNVTAGGSIGTNCKTVIFETCDDCRCAAEVAGRSNRTVIECTETSNGVIAILADIDAIPSMESANEAVKPTLANPSIHLSNTPAPTPKKKN